MARPQLSPPCGGWQRDLPGPNDPPDEAPMLLWQAPAHMDETYVEFARNTSSIRGVPFVLSLLIPWSFLDHSGLVANTIHALTSVGVGVLEVGILLLFAMSIAICVWAVWVIYRAEVSPPRGLPLRFNRLRRKVYIYDFHSVWWNPFERA